MSTHHEPPNSSLGRCSEENTPVESEDSKFISSKRFKGRLEEGNAVKNAHVKIYHIIKTKNERKRKFSSSPLLINESLKEIDGKNVFLATYPLWSHCVCAESLLPPPTIFLVQIRAHSSSELLRLNSFSHKAPWNTKILVNKDWGH